MLQRQGLGVKPAVWDMVKRTSGQGEESSAEQGPHSELTLHGPALVLRSLPVSLRLRETGRARAKSWSLGMPRMAGLILLSLLLPLSPWLPL